MSKTVTNLDNYYYKSATALNVWQGDLERNVSFFKFDLLIVSLSFNDNENSIKIFYSVLSMLQK